MDPTFTGNALKTLGEVIIGYTVIRVHSKVSREHKIDKQVISEIKRERIYALFGIFLVVFGFLLETLRYF